MIMQFPRTLPFAMPIVKFKRKKRSNTTLHCNVAPVVVIHALTKDLSGLKSQSLAKLGVCIHLIMCTHCNLIRACIEVDVMITPCCRAHDHAVRVEGGG